MPNVPLRLAADQLYVFASGQRAMMLDPSNDELRKFLSSITSAPTDDDIELVVALALKSAAEVYVSKQRGSDPLVRLEALDVVLRLEGFARHLLHQSAQASA